MSDSSISALLSSAELFQGLTREQLGKIAELMVRHTYRGGEVVVQQGNESDNVHIVETGCFEVYLWDELLRIERPLKTLRRGEVFGEMGVLTGETRSASIRCQDPGSTLVVARADYLALLEAHAWAAVALARTLAHRLTAANRARSIPFERTANFTISSETVRLLPLKLILLYRVLPLAREGSSLTVGIVDPSDFVARNTVQAFLPSYGIAWACLSAADFTDFRDGRLSKLAESATGEGPEEQRLTYLSAENPAGTVEDSAAARLLDECLLGAINAGASDLHMEPGFTNTKVRARIDGRLLEIHHPLKPDEYRLVFSRLRVLAGMDMTEHRRPQDGALRVQCAGRAIDLRLSVLPTSRGGSVVIRLLDSARRERSLRNLVVSETLADWMEDLFLQPGGLVLVTGPTGSGKTTTLYSGLQARLAQDPTCNLITAEDPVEYELDGVSQVQINERAGLSFPTTLRALLRQDPNVILIGEMRDRESMTIAVEAALTGHLVLSSLHTRTALETVARLRQQGIEPFLIASALRGIVSQRLVGKLCSACRRETPASDDALARLARAGLIQPGETPKIWSAPGCPHCRGEGVKGRVGVYEVLVMSTALQAAIQNELPEQELRQAAGDRSFIPLTRYARYLLDHGLASAEALCALFSSQEQAPAELE